MKELTKNTMEKLFNNITLCVEDENYNILANFCEDIGDYIDTHYDSDPTIVRKLLGRIMFEEDLKAYESYERVDMAFDVCLDECYMLVTRDLMNMEFDSINYMDIISEISKSMQYVDSERGFFIYISRKDNPIRISEECYSIHSCSANDFNNEEETAVIAYHFRSVYGDTYAVDKKFIKGISI